MRLKSLKIKALALLGSLSLAISSSVIVASQPGIKPEDIISLTTEEAIRLLQQADKDHKTNLPEGFRVGLESQLNQFYPGIKVENQVVAWYEPPGVYPLVVRSNLADGRKLLIALLYTGSSQNDELLGILLFETGSPGKISLYLNRPQALQISAAQTFATDKRPAKEQNWNKKYVRTSTSWTVPCNLDQGCQKGWLWFAE